MNASPNAAFGSLDDLLGGAGAAAGLHRDRAYVPHPRTGDHFGFGWEMGRIARSLALGQGYANPFNGLSGPTAWTPPLYPLLMAASFKMFGIYTQCGGVLPAGVQQRVFGGDCAGGV